MSKRESITSQFQTDPHQDGHVIVPVSIPIEEAMLLDEAQRQDEGKGLPFHLSLLALAGACEFASRHQGYSEELTPIVVYYQQLDEANSAPERRSNVELIR